MNIDLTEKEIELIGSQRMKRHDPTCKISRVDNVLFAYCILWNSKRDLQNEVFTTDTVIENIDHELPVTILDNGKFVTIGVAKVEYDRFGLFAAAVLDNKPNTNKSYINSIYALVDNNLAYFSTAATFQNDDRKHLDEFGRITLWPLYSLHITVTPADPH